MKKIITFCFLLVLALGFGQTEDKRIIQIQHQLEMLATENSGLNETFKTEIQVNNITLANFLLALSQVHTININVYPELNAITIANNFSNVTVADLLVFLCKEYDLTIDFTGNILSIKKYKKPIEIPEVRIIPISYNPATSSISIDAQNDNLYDVFKRIMDETGKNLVFTPGLENKTITAYIQQMPFDAAMDKMALANNLYVEKTKDNFYVFEGNLQMSALKPTTPSETGSNNQGLQRRRRSNFYFKVIDHQSQLLDVDLENTSIADVVNDIGDELQIDIFTATPLENAGSASFRAKSISFDQLLTKIFETQGSVSVQGTNTGQVVSNNSSNNLEKFTFKKEGNIYFFGTEKQLSVRKAEVIALQYRSVELLTDPQGSTMSNQNFSRSNMNAGNYNSYDNFNRSQNTQNLPNQNYTQNSNNKSTSLLDIIPEELKTNIDIQVDNELNSFYVIGASTDIERFKEFLVKVDKPVPVVLIEVMIIEVSKNNVVETGVSWGLGDTPVETQGGIFPETNMTFGAQTINKLIGSFNDFASFNLGKVSTNFFATIRAMESNGDLKIRSTPKLATLNGHRATFSNGQTSYYAVTQRNIYGTDNPQTTEFTNYYPIDVELGLNIKPSVSTDGSVLLDIFVVQSSFGQRIADDSPPDINSRNFTSIIRMQDQDIAILGGLEEQYKNNSGSGVPFLARIPIIKWLFSKRKREARKSKLTVLIRPTVIN